MPLVIGQAVPGFTLPSSNGDNVSLHSFRGKKLVIFFYPADLTPSCTNEACDFRDYTAQFQGLGAEVIGISPDDLQKHGKFIVSHNLPFLLLSDTDHKVAEQFGVWALKKLYGREYMGLVRSTFLIDEEGRLVREWRNIRVKGHVRNVLDALKGM